MGVDLGRVSAVSTARRGALMVAGVALCAGGLAAVPGAASGAELLADAQSAPNKNVGAGDSSETWDALAQAAKSDQRVEVTAERTATDTVWANPGGTVTREVAQAPIRAKNRAGDLVRIDTDLAGSGGRLSPNATTGDVSFSSDGAGELAKFDLAKAGSVSLAFKGALAGPVVKGDTATYAVKDAGAEQIAVSAEPNGFSSHIVLSNAPGDSGTVLATGPTYTFVLNLQGLKASLKGQSLVLSDADGTPVAQSRPLRMWDAQRDEAGDPSNVTDVGAQLVTTADGVVELRLTPSMSFLTDPSTRYPVTIDPDIGPTDAGADTYYFSGQASTDDQHADYRLRVGSQDGSVYARSLIAFDKRPLQGKNITSASLNLRQYWAGSCSAKQMELHPATSKYLTNMTWSTKPSVDLTAAYAASKSFNHGLEAGGCADASESIDVTPIVNAWGGETLTMADQVSDDYYLRGVELRAPGAQTNPLEEKRFCSANPSSASTACNSAAYVPTLSVTYVPEHGLEQWYSMTKHQLNDRSTLMVNNKNGNAVIQAGDINANGLGLDLNISRFYNSQATDTETTPTSIGKGWSLSVGPDVWLEQKSAYRFDYHAPGGTVFGSFVRKSSDPSVAAYNDFKTPTGGIDADLKFDTTTNKFTLTFHHSQLKYVFTRPGTTDAYLSSAKDRSGNSITYATSGTTSTGRPKLSTITDTGGRTYAVTYGTGTSADYITQITSNGAGARTWAYRYNTDGYLDEYTDPDGKATDYTYTPATGLDPLTKIEDPSNVASRPTTQIVYTNLQVTEVDYVREGTAAPYKFTWAYEANRAAVAECATHNHGDFATLVTDPNANKTSYCFDERKGATETKTWVYDGEGNATSASYTADNGTSAVTAPTGQATGGSTVLAYTSLSDQLGSVTEPKDETGNTAGTTYLNYAHTGAGGSATPAGGAYLPGQIKDPNRNCTWYAYDDAGRTTDAFSGVDGSSGTCGASSTGTQFHRDYNTDGTVSKSWDGNAGSSPTDADKTIYTYWASGDSGFVAGSAGQLKTVRKPGGSCNAPRKLCTSYTYDTAGRVATMTDGRGYVTTYTQDTLDRTTAVQLDPATTCSTTLSNCATFTYAYDGEGNLTLRGDPAGNTNFNYDRLNRQTLQQTPRGSAANSGTDKITMGYDGNGNLLQYIQDVHNESLDTVNYTYDKANHVATVTDATGTINMTTNEDGQTSQIKWPGTNRVQVDYAYFATGKPKSAKVKDAAGTDMGQYTYDYSITVAGFSIDTHQLQSRTITGAGTSLNGNTDYTYSPGTGRLASATNSNGTDYVYTHDKVGNVASEKIGSTTTYFGYDRAGELCWKAAITGTQIAQSCPATPSGGQTFTNDASGNNATDLGGGTIGYNTNSQLTSLGGVTSDYLDLGNDLRFKAGTPRYVNGPMGVTTKQDTTTTTYYTRDPSSGKVLNSHTSGGGNVRNYFTEPNGNTTALYGPSGTKLGSYAYSPYGDTTVTDDDSNGTAAANPFRYIGGQQDKTSGGADGYYKLGARYYDTHGHFTQPDPVSPGGGTYNYTGGDPINSSDPSGRFDFPTPGGVGFFVDVLQLGISCLQGARSCESQAKGILAGIVATATCLAILPPADLFPVVDLGCLVFGAAYGAASSFYYSRVGG